MSHKAEVIEVSEVADGALAVRVRCCGDSLTDSTLTLYELHRDDAAIDQDVAAYLQKTEALHDQRQHAKAHVERLITKAK